MSAELNDAHGDIANLSLHDDLWWGVATSDGDALWICAVEQKLSISKWVDRIRQWDPKHIVVYRHGENAFRWSRGEGFPTPTGGWPRSPGEIERKLR